MTEETPMSRRDTPSWGVSVKILQYSHGFEVTVLTQNASKATLEFCRLHLAQYGLVRIAPGRFTKAMTKVYVGVTKDRKCFYLPIDLLEGYIRHLNRFGISQSGITATRLPEYEPESLDMEYHDPRTPLDYQRPIIDYILESGNTKLVTLEPGQGKTFIALSAMRHLNLRTFICIKPMYMEKWVGDAEEAFNAQEGEIVVVKGANAFKQMIAMAQSDALDAKIIICSNKTYFNYLKAFEKDRFKMLEEGYTVAPYELFETLKVGFRIVDEVHQDWHFNMRLYLYSHVPKTLALSGTLVSDDEFISKSYEMVFPRPIRFNVEQHKPYVTAECWFYQCPNAETRIKYMNHAMKVYSHIRFEQSVIKQYKLYKAYEGMILDMVEKRFIERHAPEQKLLIFSSTVDMATRLSEALIELCPDYRVNRYVSEDDYEEMLSSDIIVSTLKSLGTAHDIPDLWMVLMTDAIGSRQANLQAMGRLRKLKRWPEDSPEFLYLTCLNIDKHIDYHQKKKDIFRGRVLTHKEVTSDYRL